MENNNDLIEIITQTLNELKNELGEDFDISKVNLAELERRTGISRARLRKLKNDGFVVLPHASKGRKAASTVLSGFTGIIDTLLKAGVTNSSVHFDRLRENGYTGGRTAVKITFTTTST